MKMPHIKILLADNDPDFLETRREFLVREGYEVIAACSPAEAETELRRQVLNLAIIDVRLLNDDDEKDISGLELVKNVHQSVPIIILTGYPVIASLREALRQQTKSDNSVRDFILKEEGPIVLLTAVRKALESVKKPQMNVLLKPEASDELGTVTLSVAEQMFKDYELARQHARWIGWTRLALIIGGALVFLFGIVISILGHIEIGITGAAGGVIAQILGRLLTGVANDANRRWEQFHKELNILYKQQQEQKKSRGR